MMYNGTCTFALKPDNIIKNRIEEPMFYIINEGQYPCRKLFSLKT